MTNEERVRAIRERQVAAHKMVVDLCHKRREWIMSIPARPDYDPDLVIDASLSDIPYLLSRVEELQAEVQKHQVGESYELGYQRGTDAAAKRVEELQQQVARLERELADALTCKACSEAGKFCPAEIELMKTRAEAEKAKGERDYKEQEYEKLRAMFFKMVDAKDTQIGPMREALRKLRVRCHASINGGGLQQFNAQEALREIKAALTPEPAQSGENNATK